MVAVRAGDDNLARQALSRKQEHETISTQFQQQWISQKQAVEKLKDALRLLNNKIEEAKRKKNILIARKKRAEAQQQIANTMQGLGDTSAFDTFDRMAERIQLMEAEAEAGAELAGELSGDTLESKFLQLEQGSGGAEEDALNELKAKMGLLEAPKGEAAKQLAAGGGASGGGGRDDHDKKDQSGPVGPSLTAEDLKELEDLDLSDVEKDTKKPA
jgi:phage shock protein A